MKGVRFTMTTIYIIRHSKPLKVNNDANKDSLQIQNEKLTYKELIKKGNFGPLYIGMVNLHIMKYVQHIHMGFL